MSPSSLRRLLVIGLLLSIAPLGISVNAAAGGPVRIAVLGDSLAAGFGLDPSDAFPAQLQRALQARGHAVEVANHGVSGDTSAGGRQRVEWMLLDRPRVVLVELGANDALRGLDPGRLEANLDAILATLEASGVTTLLAGMRAPPNLGAEYTARFDAVYPRLAARWGVGLYPFFLEGVAGREELNQHDGIHPNARGVARIVAGILPLVETTLVQ
jgi:acyl-CoA thioesterase-1